MFLDGTLRYTDYSCEGFSSYTRVVFYKLKNNIYRFIITFLTTFLTTYFIIIFCIITIADIYTINSNNIKFG